LPESPLHKEIRHAIVKIGKLEKFDAKTEWPPRAPNEPESFDGVWIVAGGQTPTHVFEVQVGGDPHQALGKLTRARKRWNCEIRLVTTRDQRADLTALVEKTLSAQDSKACKVIDIQAIRKLKRWLTTVSDIRKEIGY